MASYELLPLNKIPFFYFVLLYIVYKVGCHIDRDCLLRGGGSTASLEPPTHHTFSSLFLSPSNSQPTSGVTYSSRLVFQLRAEVCALHYYREKISILPSCRLVQNIAYVPTSRFTRSQLLVLFFCFNELKISTRRE